MKMRFKNQRCLGCRAKHLNPTPQVSGSTIVISFALCPWHRRVHRPWHLAFPADIPYYFYRLLFCILASPPWLPPGPLAEYPAHLSDHLAGHPDHLSVPQHARWHRADADRPTRCECAVWGFSRTMIYELQQINTTAGGIG